MFDKYNLKIGSWNIGGNAKVKCEHDDVTPVIKSHDIFAILESWLDHKEPCPPIENYNNFRSERKKKSKAKRNSEGMIIYCRKTLSKGIRKRKSSLQDILWLQLDRSFLGLPNDLYICVAYLPPESSVYAKNTDLFQDFSSEIDYYSTLGNVVVIGDLNARVDTNVETQMALNFYPGVWNC